MEQKALLRRNIMKGVNDDELVLNSFRVVLEIDDEGIFFIKLLAI
jgi:hypothetical protein